MSVVRPMVQWKSSDVTGTTTAAPQAIAPVASAPPPADDFFPITSGSGRSPDVDAGVCPLVLHDVKKVTGPNRFEPGKEQTQYHWYFRLADDIDAAEGTFIFYSGLSLKSQKFLTILTALGIDTSAKGFRPSEQIGKRVQGLVELTDRGYPKLVNVFPAA